MDKRPPINVDDGILKTLYQQAEDAHCAAPMCRPFRADILREMIAELMAWRRAFPETTYDAVTGGLHTTRN